MPVTARSTHALLLCRGFRSGSESDIASASRVEGRTFATLPQSDLLRMMLDQPGIRAAAAEHPEVCTEFYWHKRLACVEIDLTHADAELIRDLLTDAWEHQAHR